MRRGHAFSMLCIVLVVVGGIAPVSAAPQAADGSVRGPVQTDTATGSVPELSADTSGTQSNVIRTEHFEITYEEGARSDAESVAAYADTYYELLFQRFGVAPPTERTSVEVVAGDTVECGGDQRAGCYEGGIGAGIKLTSDDRGVFYHELTHRFQAHVGILGPGTAITPGVVVEGTAHHIETPSETIAASATFSRDAINLSKEDIDGDEYAEQSLFVEYVLHEYGRAGYDALYMDQPRSQLASVVGEEYADIVEDFYDQLDEQRTRMEAGGASAPGFTYDSFLVEHGEEVTFDARTPSAIESLGRTWYNGEVESYEWDFDGDGETDASGPTVTRTIDDPVDKAVTLYVTIDGERHAVTQELLPAASPAYEVENIGRGNSTLTYMGLDSWADFATVPGRNFSVDVTVANDGDIAGSDSVALLFDGEVVDTRPVTVETGESRTVTLSYRVPEDIETSANHDYRIRVGDEMSREKTVYAIEELRVRLAPYGGPGIEPALRGGSTAETHVSNDTTVRVTVPTRVENNDAQDVDTTIALYLDDRRVATESVLLASDRDSPTFTFTTPSTPGKYGLRAEIADAGVGMNATAMNHTLVVEDRTQADEPFISRCAPTLNDYCSLTLESTDAPETVAVGTEAEFAVTLREKDGVGVGGRFAVQMGVDGDEERISTNASDGRGTVTLTRAFDSTGTYDITINERVVHTVEVVERTTTTRPEGTTESKSEEPSTTDDGTPSTASTTTEGGVAGSETTSPGAPGFGVGVTLIAGLVAAVLARASVERS